jgi:hypothetical protein
MGEPKLTADPARTVYVAAPTGVTAGFATRLSAAGDAAGWRLTALADQRALETLLAGDRLVREGAVVLVDQVFLELLSPAQLERLGHPHVVLLAERGLEDTVRLFGKHHGLCHILVKNDSLLPRQLHMTLDRIAGRAAGGAAGYLQAGATVRRETLRGSGERQACIDRILELVDGVPCFTELRSAAATIASELLMNAIFNAPYDYDRLKPRYKDRPRHQTVALKPGEEVGVEYGFDRELFVLTCRDNFGMLGRDVLRTNLLRSAAGGGAQVRMQTAGAGVGLYMVLSLANQLDISVKPGHGTEITTVIGLSKRYVDFERRGNSLNYFSEP